MGSQVSLEQHVISHLYNEDHKFHPTYSIMDTKESINSLVTPNVLRREMRQKYEYCQASWNYSSSVTKTFVQEINVFQLLKGEAFTYNLLSN